MDDSQEKLIIRKEQMDVLNRHMLRKFEDRMVIHLKTTFPDQTKDMREADMRTMIKTGIKKAIGYNVVMEDDVQRYLEYMVRYSPDFDTNPKTSWAVRTLQTENLDGSKKMDRIDEYVRFESEDQR